MFKGIDAALLFSENATKLAEFYREKVGLKQTMEAEMGEKGEANIFGFEFGTDKTSFYIMDHSKVKGKNKEANRYMVNLEVDDIEGEAKRLKDAGVKVVQEIYHVESYGYVATFEDVDGNYFQLVKVRE